MGTNARRAAEQGWCEVGWPQAASLQPEYQPPDRSGTTDGYAAVITSVTLFVTQAISVAGDTLSSRFPQIRPGGLGMPLVESPISCFCRLADGRQVMPKQTAKVLCNDTAYLRTDGIAFAPVSIRQQRVAPGEKPPFKARPPASCSG